jgi:hypothetical protein
LGAACGQVHQLRRPRIVERAQQHTIDDGEDRGIGADPEAERHDGDEGEDRRAAKRPQAVAKVGSEVAECGGTGKTRFAHTSEYTTSGRRLRLEAVSEAVGVV